MRKRIVGSSSVIQDVAAHLRWLDLEQVATVEVTSEDPDFPVEAVFDSDSSIGWRASQEGKQELRIIFDEPTTLHRMQLYFVETEVERTQEFVIRWSSAQGGPMREVVRQQWNFSPAGSTSEVEYYDVNLRACLGPGIIYQTGLMIGAKQSIACCYVLPTRNAEFSPPGSVWTFVRGDVDLHGVSRKVINNYSNPHGNIR
jgi:hypothetical protein